MFNDPMLGRKKTSRPDIERVLKTLGAVRSALPEKCLAVMIADAEPGIASPTISTARSSFLYENGTPEKIRTPDPQFRSLARNLESLRVFAYTLHRVFHFCGAHRADADALHGLSYRTIRPRLTALSYTLPDSSRSISLNSRTQS